VDVVIHPVSFGLNSSYLKDIYSFNLTLIDLALISSFLPDFSLDKGESIFLLSWKSSTLVSHPIPIDGEGNPGCLKLICIGNPLI
jgi:hypothetical protein